MNNSARTGGRHSRMHCLTVGDVSGAEMDPGDVVSIHYGEQAAWVIAAIKGSNIITPLNQRFHNPRADETGGSRDEVSFHASGKLAGA
jgi:hypothetical protein